MELASLLALLVGVAGDRAHGMHLFSTVLRRAARSSPLVNTAARCAFPGVKTSMPIMAARRTHTMSLASTLSQVRRVPPRHHHRPLAVKSVDLPAEKPKVAIFSARAYEKPSLTEMILKRFPGSELIESPLSSDTAELAKGFDAVSIFVNDDASGEVVAKLAESGVTMIALRCAGYDKVDLEACQEHGMRVLRVPSYDPVSISEHAVAMLLALNRRIPVVKSRLRMGMFSLDGLVGRRLQGQTVGLIGYGQIGHGVAQILGGGFGMRVLAYDLYEPEGAAPFLQKTGGGFVEPNDVGLAKLLGDSDVVSLHVPLTEATYHFMNDERFGMMKKGATLINTARGAIVDTSAAIRALLAGQLQAFGLDVFEGEGKLFFQDFSKSPSGAEWEAHWDDQLASLLLMPNVLVTAHQAFLTEEALAAIAQTTADNIENPDGTANAVVPAHR